MSRTLLPLLLLAVTLLGWTGCKEDDPTALTTINYDGPNASAPQLPPGRNLFAAYFPSSVTQQYAGRTMDRIRFYLNTIPLATSVVVFEEGPDDRTPGREIYRENMTNQINTLEWIEDRLVPGIPITGDGIWLAVEVELADGEPFSLGCDAGRSYNPNGDFLLLSTSPGRWATFNEINGERVNWNIRGVLAEE